MNAVQTKKGQTFFQHLPAYAEFLLQQRLDAFTWKNLRINIEANVPLLKMLSHLSEQELFEISKPSQVEFLSSIVSNQYEEYVQVAMSRWINNQVPLIGRYDVEAIDITIASHSRSKALKSFLKEYSNDLDLLLELNLEIDELIHFYTTRGTDTYITLLKEKITEEENFSSNLIQASPGITFIYDLNEQKEDFITGKVSEVTGYTPDEITRMPNLLSEIIYPEDLPIVMNLLQQTAVDTEGKTYTAEYRVRKKDNSFPWMRVYTVVYDRDEDGKPKQIIGVAYDISAEKETALALEKRENQLLEAQSIGKIGSFEWDVLKDQSVSTPELRKIFETTERQNLQEMLSNVHPEDKEAVTKALQHSFITGVFEVEYRYRANSGEKVIESKGIVTYDEKRQPVKLVGTIQDITERKRTEENLVHKSLELERSNEQLQQFAFIASHDLKEPLRKMVMFSDMIITSDWDNLSETTRNNLQKIVEASRRMQQLIEGILSYSTLNTKSDKESYSLEDALKEAKENLEFKITQSNAIITSDGLPKLDVVPFQMIQLFQNLIGNALKFSKKDVDPVINITHSIIPRSKVNVPNLANASNYLEIKIQDNGIGFNNEVAEKIFGLFQRLHARSSYEGSGLGLAICKRIVEFHGGSITASGEEGKGAVFTILLPVKYHQLEEIKNTSTERPEIVK